MGTWDQGPFDNDGAADFLAETSPRALADTLRRCADAPPDEYLDVDDGQPAIAAAEIVALGFGYGNLDAAPAPARALARTIGPNEELRKLALRAIPRVRALGTSELASLWNHEPAWDASLADLLARLTDAGD